MTYPGVRGHRGPPAPSPEPAPPARRKPRPQAASHPTPPPWLMSYGDMMTLFLCFFIVLTTMADKQEGGLMAAGLGQFVSVLENQGALEGAMETPQRLGAVNAYRARFGLPPELETSTPGGPEPGELDKLEALVEKELRPHAVLPVPEIALFSPDSAELTTRAKRYLDRVAETLRPRFGQVLVLEGHAIDAGRRFGEDDTLLGLSRALAVRAYLIERHEFVPRRVEARAWPIEYGALGRGSNVDARLVEPVRAPASGGS